MHHSIINRQLFYHHADPHVHLHPGDPHAGLPTPLVDMAIPRSIAAPLCGAGLLFARAPAATVAQGPGAPSLPGPGPSSAPSGPAGGAPSHHPRAVPCPAAPGDGDGDVDDGAPAAPRGYVSLADLRADWDAYFGSLTPSPTVSRPPTAPPSPPPASAAPVAAPTGEPSALTTPAPITPRPTEIPTSGIVGGPGGATASPAPTVEAVVIDGGGGGGTGGGAPGTGGGTPAGDGDATVPGGTTGRRLASKRQREHRPPGTAFQRAGPGGNAPAEEEEESGSDDDAVVTFLLCPGAAFSFADDGDGPLVLASPRGGGGRPVALACLPGPGGDDGTGRLAGCAFVGGDVHLRVDGGGRGGGNGADVAVDASSPLSGGGALPAPALAVTGVAFRDASRAAVLLRGAPRSPVRFAGCRWEGNAGDAAVVINGTYVAMEATTTTTSSTVDWSFFGDDDGLGDVGPDRDRGRALQLQGPEEAASVVSIERSTFTVSVAAAAAATTSARDVPPVAASFPAFVSFCSCGLRTSNGDGQGL